MPRIVIRCEDRQTRIDWRHLVNRIDDDSDYEDVVKGLVEYFEEDEARIDTVRRFVKGPDFR